MDQKLLKGLNLIKLLVESKGDSIEQIKDLLGTNYSAVKLKDDMEKLEYLKYAIIDGFFHCAAKDIVFTDIGNIKKTYGRTLDQAYPIASETFMKLARTYWTFKVTLIECIPHNSTCIQLLQDVDINFAGLFFPTPGPFSPSREQREITMRALLASSGANLDIEDFVKGNPYLM
jgi:hypothetical protein